MINTTLKHIIIITISIVQIKSIKITLSTNTITYIMFILFNNNIVFKATRVSQNPNHKNKIIYTKSDTYSY
jgi:hypothetical protein